MTDNTTSPAKVSIKSQCYGTSIIHLTHTNVGTRFRGRRQGLVAALATAGAKSVATPPREFLLMTAGETGSERSKFRDRKRACTPVGSLGMEG